MGVGVDIKKLFLFLAIIALFTGGIAVPALADEDDDDDLSQLACEAGKVMTGILFEDDDEILDVICVAILNLQLTIDSFFDIFVELEDTADFNCPDGQHAVGTGENGEILCAPIPTFVLPDQNCPLGQTVVGIDVQGNIICNVFCSPENTDLTCSDGIDNDCDGLLDSADPSCSGPELCDGFDNDLDPTTPDGADEVWLGQSCDGADADFCSEGFFQCFAGAQICTDTTGDNVEVADGVDNDCDGQVDEGFSTCDDAKECTEDVIIFGLCSNDPLPQNTQCGQGLGLCDGNGQCIIGGNVDADQDGWTVAEGDCDDSDPDVYPEAPEIPDGLDNDCDGDTDEGLVISNPFPLVINEIEYDTLGFPEDLEFIEIYNTGPDRDLTGFSLELINGQGGVPTVYHTIPLTGIVLSGDYFVVSDPLVLNLDLEVTPLLIQNGGSGGGDCVRLIDPNSGPWDSVCYEGSVLNIGEGNSAPEDSANIEGSISRIPNGVDTDNNEIDFVFSTIITPGSMNLTPAPFCGDGFVDQGEQCDDGNQINGDGCTQLCLVDQCITDADCGVGQICLANSGVPGTPLQCVPEGTIPPP